MAKRKTDDDEEMAKIVDEDEDEEDTDWFDIADRTIDALKAGKDAFHGDVVASIQPPLLCGYFKNDGGKLTFCDQPARCICANTSMCHDHFKAFAQSGRLKLMENLDLVKEQNLDILEMLRKIVPKEVKPSELTTTSSPA